MLKELVTLIAIIIALSGVIAGFVINEKAAQKLETQVEEVIQKANENY